MNDHFSLILRFGMNSIKSIFSSGHNFLLISFLVVFFINEANAQKKPNIVLIVIDDLNDYVQGFGGHEQALTPHISTLAKSGVSFQKAYCNVPICGPSRSSFLTGVYPHNSNNLFFDKWYENQVLSNTNTVMEQFKNNGYQVIGTGKVMHHLKRETWNEFKNPADYGPVVYNGKEGISHPDVPEPFRNIGKIDGSFGPFINLENRTVDGDSIQWTTGNKWRGFKEFKYVNDQDRSLTPDEKNANWVEERLFKLANSGQEKPFFLVVGFLRPHTPLVAPQRFFDQFPLEEIQLPVIKKYDKDDTYFSTVKPKDLTIEDRGPYLYNQIGEAYKDQELGLKKFIQAYLACTAAVDENVGQVMNAIDNSSLKDNTIVILVSDHGWQMGQKDYLYKNSLWEESARIPMMIRAPGLTKPKGQVDHPVSLIDIYPTLVELAGLPKETRKNSDGKSLDGFSLMPFLKNTHTDQWAGPKAALTTVYAGAEHHQDPTMQHYSIRTKNWRYILYNNGKEELYNHSDDPYEWKNLLMGNHDFEIKRTEMQILLKNLTHPVIPKGLTQ